MALLQDLKKKITPSIPSILQRNQDFNQYLVDFPKSDEPWFYCSLCSNFYIYHDLIDGCTCPHCDNDLFVVGWYDIREYLRHSTIMFQHPYNEKKRRKSWVG